MNIRYGKATDTSEIDNNGGIAITTRKYHDYKVMNTTRRYEIPVKVRNDREELEEILAFRRDKADKQDLEIKYKRDKHGDANGYYFVVKCWSEPVE